MNIFSKIKNYLFLDVDVKMNWFSRFVAGLKLREAINKADDAFRENGNRYYVLPSWRGKDLIVMDRKSFRQLKHKRYITHKVFVRDVERECFYCTPYNNGAGKLSSAVMAKKRNQYYSWLEAIDKSRKNGKVRKH